MSAVRFGALQVAQANQYGDFTHLRINVSGVDRAAFIPMASGFNADEDYWAQIGSDTWRFTVGVGPSKAGVRVIPGHVEKFDESIFEANTVLYAPKGLVRKLSEPLIREAVTQIPAEQADVQETLKTWLA